MKFNGCIFDLDGVLVDTAQYHYQAWKKLANSLGFDVSVAQNEQLKGISRTESLAKLLAWGGLSLPEGDRDVLAERKNGWYVDMISSMTPSDPLPGVRTLLNELKRKRIGLAIGSASKNARMILEKTELVDYFEVIVDGHMVSRSKPAPDVFLLGAEKLGYPPADCLVVEDAPAGIEAARRAGMKTVGVGRPEDLVNADIVISDLQGISIAQLNELFH